MKPMWPLSPGCHSCLICCITILRLQCKFFSYITRVKWQRRVAFSCTRMVKVYQLESPSDIYLEEEIVRHHQDINTVLVVTHNLFLKMNVRRPFELLNFDLPLYFSDYENLVGMAGKTTTFINEKSSGICLFKLVESDDHNVPEFVKKVVKGRR
ncbi:hypothetical protein POM88_051860 [Heracleum sosnowskyi]|uniref:Uncharacterized protein n=1 Tax=Heracleum sosnowskyi TaxID=360622 RepID=A0AAD8GQX7_9APIA|nr:hypothetical protein POM88_051860 [Heracleum sosnowskyi]